MMTSPLSPAADAMLNSTSSTSSSRKSEDDYDAMTSTPKTEMSQPESSSRPSSRIRNDDARFNQENISPVKSRHSRIMSGTELSPLRIVESQRSSLDGSLLKVSGGVRSPRKVSPDRRFPVKINLSGESPSRAAHEQPASIDEVVRDHDGLKRAISIFEDSQRSIREEEEEEGEEGEGGGDGRRAGASPLGMDYAEAHRRGDATAGDEDFMDVSAFSTFSAVPNMAMLAKLGQTPNGRREAKRAHHAMEDDSSGNTSNLLMDFNERLGRSHRSSPARRDILSPSRTTPNLASTATPSRQLANLIDLDMGPMATPRSVPSITARELESLKSNFLSEISSLKASLSGKEAEVHSLKTAVGDAEKRVGESMERLREERALKEEMESVLRIVREEIIETQKEKEELEQQLDESEKRREASEMMHQEAESKLAGLRAGKDMERHSSPEKPVSNTREVEIAVERVARELHALYKSKHETKVAALKKSYENRWEKKVRELEAKIQGLSEENERLLAGHDATLTKVDHAGMEAQSARDHATIRELEADVQRLEAVVSTVRRDNDDLRASLQQERVEKGELVQLAEELMSMQNLAAATPAPQRQQPAPQPAPAPAPAPQPQPEPQRQPTLGRSDSVSKTPRANPANRISGIRAPGTVLRAPHERGKSSIGGGLPRPGGARGSGIMSNIEKMGNYRGRE
ncbi:kinetoplast-associated kap [Trichoderma cornu-damae]|uniref:Kinetoplast-associated kap n=1 Tax=Trichoderma cornu-damae TaxID=654480 RepID=A0A9P8QQM2_9HYPO|nr:kinetoplast-associated kap [Trichoderma cornu-damae]